MPGLTDYAEALALDTLLPNGTNRYVGLFKTMANDAGSGGVEASGVGYARVAHSAWLNVASGEFTYRKNNGAVTFAALTGQLADVVGWGIFDALIAGNLIAAGLIKDVTGTAIVKTFISGDQPRFVDQELKVGIG